MTYNFDEVINRKNTHSVKWDGLETYFGNGDLLPMWVADMDFRTPPFVMKALRQCLDHEVLGYPSAYPEWGQAIVQWLHRRHQWCVSEEMLTFVPGVVRGQAFALQCFTQPGDKVLVMSPVYHPFFLVTEKMGREVVRCPLTLNNRQYQIDFERFRRDVKGCKVFILCNPHNPGGRVWSKAELEQIARICHENGTMVISDEIHADLTFPPYKHLPFASVCREAEQISLTFMAPSKAFNMPGLASSYAVTVDEDIRMRFQSFMEAGEFAWSHTLATVGTIAAYQQGDEWLDEMLAYVQGNIDYLEAYLKTYLPQIGIIRPQASYLVYLDCRALNLSQEELVRLFIDKARLALNDGSMFGPEGKGFMRLNVGCPRSLLEQALLQLTEALR
ncbi:MAG: pyridoxal phosphate-dependent aminotransferase [Mediterranea massiliensis]|nr:pyridoxal phosphate-dependent aminotransferase [Mediterranea massiliensis]